MAYGTMTANVMDAPLSISSVVAPYLSDNNYKHTDMNSIRVLSIANGTLADYNEASATAPFGAATLVVPTEQTLTLAYNKSMLLRIQKTQMQDIPVSRFSKKVAMQQADEVFVPAHDAYSLGKILASRPAGNKVLIDLHAGASTYTGGGGADEGGDAIKLQFARTVSKARTGGANAGNMCAWIGYEYADILTDKINFTGSDQGYKDAKAGYLGKYKGVKCIEVPDDYLGEGVYVIMADKRAIVNVKPKMDPKGDGVVVIEKVPGFSGVEIQLRDRGDTFVLSKKVDAVASLEEDATA